MTIPAETLAETLVLTFIALVAVFSPAAAVAAHSTVVGA